MFKLIANKIKETIHIKQHRDSLIDNAQPKPVDLEIGNWE